MANASPPSISIDPRRRKTTQAYPVHYGGMPLESGAAGYGGAMSMTTVSTGQMTIDLTKTEPQSLTIAPYVYSNKYVVVEGGGGSPVADIVVADPTDIPGTATTLAAGVDLGSTMSADAAYDTGLNIDVEPKVQEIQVTVTTPGTGYATIMFYFNVVQTGWK